MEFFNNRKIGRNILLAVFAILLVLSARFTGISRAENTGSPGLSAIPDTITVTGEPASESHIRNVVARFLERSGFSGRTLENVKFGDLKPGETITVNLPLVLRNPANPQQPGETLTARTFKTVTVKNEYMPPVSPVLLGFSNHPEKIKLAGLLFEVGALKGRPLRLRYYHQGDPQSPAHYINIYAINDSSNSARLHITEGVGGPSTNWLMAGHMNNVRFFHNIEKNLGWTETVPAKSTYLLNRYHLKPDEVISGTADLHVLEGGPLRILVHAAANPEDGLTYPLKVDEKDRHTRGAYPVTAIDTNVTYSLDQGEVFHTIGDTPIQNIFAGRNNRGNYGVMYTYRFRLRNPYDSERSMSFFFQPRGGVATATFSFDGRPVSVGITRAFEMVKLATVSIPAKSERIVEMKTMPEDASNYPVRIILLPSE
jgi:hypothetical protein